MNILYVNDFAASFPGSFIESLWVLSKELNSQGHKISFIFPLERDYIRQLKNIGTVYYCPSFMGKKFDYTLLKLVCQICKKEKIDIIHTNFGLAGFISANLVSGITHCKHIAHERSLSQYLFNKKIYKIKFIKAKLIFKILQFISKPYFIAISSGVKESLANYNKIKSKNICVIPNAVSLKHSKRSEIKHLENIYNLTTNKLVVGMIAHFGPNKDHKTLIDAAEIVIEKIPNVIFLLVGGNMVSDKLNFRKQIFSYINEKKLESNFHFTGEVIDPMPYVELFDIGCLISNWEGFGNALVEYMLKKKPVIGTAVGGIKDIIDDDINGFLIPPQRPDILADKIIYLLGNPKIARKMGEKGYKKAIENYNMDNWVKKIIKLYNT